MDIDFPLILVVLVVLTGLIWLVDRVMLFPRRMASVEDFKQRKSTSPSDSHKQDASFEETVETLKREHIIVEYSISFFPVLLLVLVLRSFLVEPFQIPTGSMIPTLAIGDFILVNKYAYGIRLPVLGTKIIGVGEPKNGDVMVFIPPHESKYFIKRVIGIPGDRIGYKEKKLYINGKEATQEFVARLPPHNPSYLLYREKIGEEEHYIQKNLIQHEELREWDIPEGYYFMMGDNRDRSSDSRFWGLVPEENIVGKAFAIWIHKDPGWNLPEFSRNAWIE